MPRPASQSMRSFSRLWSGRSSVSRATSPSTRYLHELKFVELGRGQRQRAKNFDVRVPLRHEIAPVLRP